MEARVGGILVEKAEVLVVEELLDVADLVVNRLEMILGDLGAHVDAEVLPISEVPGPCITVLVDVSIFWCLNSAPGPELWRQAGQSQRNKELFCFFKHYPRCPTFVHHGIGDS